MTAGGIVAEARQVERDAVDALKRGDDAVPFTGTGAERVEKNQRSQSRSTLNDRRPLLDARPSP